MLRRGRTEAALTHFLLLLLALSIIPLITMILHIRFEAARWEESEFAPVSKFTSG